MIFPTIGRCFLGNTSRRVGLVVFLGHVTLETLARYPNSDVEQTRIRSSCEMGGLEM